MSAVHSPLPSATTLKPRRRYSYRFCCRALPPVHLRAACKCRLRPQTTGTVFAKPFECWMVHNGLKLNQEKTELVVISSKYRFIPNVDFVQVGVERIEPTSTVRNLSVVMDQFFNADHHITAICKTSQYHLRNIARIRKYLDEAFTETLVHAFVSSKVDHCNAPIHGLPKYQLNRLQLVLNTAVRVVTCTRKYDHITPVLIKLHWLPVYYRVLFKVLLLVFKALNGLAPNYVSDLLNKRVSVRSVRSNSQELLNIP